MIPLLNIQMLAAPGYYDFWGPSILYNPNHELLHKIPSNWYQILFNRLLQPSPEFKSELEQFKQEHFGKFTVGIQVRTWGQGVGVEYAMRNPNIPIEVFLQVTWTAPIDVTLRLLNCSLLLHL